MVFARYADSCSLKEECLSRYADSGSLNEECLSRYADSGSLKEECLSCSPHELATKASDILEKVSSFFESEKLLLDLVRGCRTDGAPAI